MGADDIGDYLKSVYPKYQHPKVISAAIDISLRNTFKILAKMRKRDEVEYIIIKSSKKTGIWITKYRIRRE